MKIWQEHNTQDILKSLEMELAKTQNELKCLEEDCKKAKGRIAFVITGIHHLKTTIDLEE